MMARGAPAPGGARSPRSAKMLTKEAGLPLNPVYTLKDVSVYLSLFLTTIFVNKYVLSVLGFTYPAIFQGWQTLVGAGLLKLATVTWLYGRKPLFTVTPLDLPGVLNLLPRFLLFVVGIVAGSRALASLQIPVFLSVCNLLPAVLYFLDSWGHWKEVGLLPLVAASTTAVTAILVVFLGLDVTFSDAEYFWLIGHVVCFGAIQLHSRVLDNQYSETDRLYYSYIASLIMLAPVSLYLEEAFQVLHFRHLRQIHFYVLCCISGVTGATLNMYPSWSTQHLEETDGSQSPVKRKTSVASQGQKIVFSEAQLIAFSRIVASALAAWLFKPRLNLDVWCLLGINLVAAYFIPVVKRVNDDIQMPFDI